MTESDLTSYLAENPRMTGVLFTLLLLLVGAGNAAAQGMTVYVGP